MPGGGIDKATEHITAITIPTAIIVGGGADAGGK